MNGKPFSAAGLCGFERLKRLRPSCSGPGRGILSVQD